MQAYRTESSGHGQERPDLRDVMLSAQPSEDSHEQALIGYEEWMVAIQALEQAVTVLDLQLSIYVPKHGSPFLRPIVNTHFLTLKTRTMRQNANLK